VRMAHLAIVASHKINGVSALHSDLMVKTIFADFARLWPQRFINVTNGVTLGRWVMHANPHLTQWLDATIGKKWRKQSTQLETLLAHAKKPEAHLGFTAAKLANKQRLVDLIRRDLGISVDPHSLFDVQVKRIHEYKRQLLNLMHVVARYQAIVANPQGHSNAETGKLTTWVPRTVVFSGKAASAYVAAKQIIRLIHDVARVVNSDPRVGDKLKVVYLPDYSVSLAEKIIPAADLSEQVSTAGTEASGTGNMKFALNGALTIGTWDGANIEMAQAIGEANVFIFGLRTDEVAATKLAGYDPRLHYEENKVLQGVVDAISGGVFCPGDPDRYRAMMQQLLRHDPYLLLADFESYCQAQAKVDVLYKDQNAWVEKAILNVAGMGGFSSDRTIAQYVDQVWAKPGAAG
jgi:glycogen phosphorylase